MKKKWFFKLMYICGILISSFIFTQEFFIVNDIQWTKENKKPYFYHSKTRFSSRNWNFSIGVPYPNPCNSDTVKVNLSIWAMGNKKKAFETHVTSKVFNISGQLIRSTDHGWISPSYCLPIVVIPNANSLPSGVYMIQIICNCPGLSEKGIKTQKSIIQCKRRH